ncbi:MAG: hypothetical protein MH213_15215 [Marinobacter sp.]|nr:hypothetical protein [Marinobacter sp.]
MIPQSQSNRLCNRTWHWCAACFSLRVSLARQYEAKIEVVCGLAPISPNVQGVANIYIGQEESEEFHRQARDRVKIEVEKQVEAMCRSAIIDDPKGLQFVQ